MQWTTEKPTEPGWYWWRLDERKSPIVFLRCGDNFHTVIDLYDGWDGTSPDGGEWSGPIPEPEEPEG